MTERTRPTDSEQSQKIISFYWREDTVLRKQLSSLEAMKRQVETSFNLDQRLLYHRFQGKLQRAELARARLALHRESSPQATGAIVDTRYGSTRGALDVAVRMTHGKMSIRSRQEAPTASRGLVSSRTVWKPISWKNTRCATANTDAWGRALSRRGTPLTIKPQPRSAVGNLHQAEETWRKPGSSRMELMTPTVKDESSGLTSAGTFGQVKTPSQERGPSVTQRSRESSARVIAAGSTGSWQNALNEKVHRFLRSAKEQAGHRAVTSTNCDIQILVESLGSDRRKRVPMDQLPHTTEGEDGLKWQPTASRSLTMRRLDYGSPQQDTPAELLLLESYCALVTKENLEERKWINNSPYNGSF